MLHPIIVPEMGESIQSGILSSWHVQDGQFVEKGALLYELETDKITSEATAEHAGVIRIEVAEGTEVNIGQTLGTIDSEGSAKMQQQDSGPAQESKAPAPHSETKDEEMAASVGPAPQRNATSADPRSPANAARPAAAAAAQSQDSAVAQSQVAGIVEGQSITESQTQVGRSSQAQSAASDSVAGSSGGTPSEVAAAAASSIVGNHTAESAATQPAAAGSSLSPESALVSLEQQNSKSAVGDSDEAQNAYGRTTRSRISPLRERIAQRLVQVKNETAMLTTFNECDMSAVMALRKAYQEGFQEKYGVKLGFMSFFVKAVVSALKTFPAVNTQLEGKTLIQNHYYDIGIAVSTEKGLMVPILRGCDAKSLAQIERDILAYAQKARDGKISLEDLSGGVFTLTNGGVFGSMLSTPILNPPQSAILGMHSIEKRAVVREEAVVIRPIMYLALSYDHRVIDGKEAVSFLKHVKSLIEDPTQLLLLQ